MSVRVQEQLKELGFSRYEIACYLALVARHPANGSQVSKLSGVARSKVYDVLRSMADRGLVGAVGGRDVCASSPGRAHKAAKAPVRGQPGPFPGADQPLFQFGRPRAPLGRPGAGKYRLQGQGHDRLGQGGDLHPPFPGRGRFAGPGTGRRPGQGRGRALYQPGTHAPRL